MRNKVGQEATEEMSAFKGVVNLCIVVLPHLSQHVTCFQGGPRTNPENTQVLSDCETAREKAPLVRIFGSDSFYLKKTKNCHIRVREEEERLHMSNSSRLQARSPAGPTLLALKWRPDEVSVILGAHRLQVEASLPRRLSVWALWMMKAAKMLSHLSVTSLGAKRNPLSLRKERERNCNCTEGGLCHEPAVFTVTRNQSWGDHGVTSAQVRWHCFDACAKRLYALNSHFHI